MERTRTAAAVAGGILAVLWGAASLAGAEEQTLKQLMGQNFAGVQTILVALVDSNYSAVPKQVKLIEEHATQLTRMAPQIAPADRERFLGFAYNLRGNAADLGSIVQALIEHDEGKQQIAADELRVAAAAHFGGMVTMCVACHNQFRPHVVR
jgi:hypothetical protein